MISTADRRRTVSLINNACHDGARLAQACRVVDISVRTYQRWTEDGKVKPDKRPITSRPEPANKLTPEERQSVLDICHQPEYASLPPGQIVPILADQGTYIASESSFYRILHAADEQHHRGRSRKPQSVTPPQGYCATGANQVWSWDISVLQQRKASAMREKLHERWRTRPSEVCLQGPASNHLQRHRSKAVVVSVEGKGVTNTSGMNREGEHP